MYFQQVKAQKETREKRLTMETRKTTRSVSNSKRNHILHDWEKQYTAYIII